MCGIIFAISRDARVELPANALQGLRSRGPDSLVVHHDLVHVGEGRNGADAIQAQQSTWHLTFASSVLSLRGNKICVQPLVDHETGSVLCWNGEAWRIGGSSVQGNDSRIVFDLLLAATTKTKPQGDEADTLTARARRIMQVLTSITGPYAFVFFDAPAANIYYSRDRLGRRSLLSNTSHLAEAHSDDFIVSSFAMVPGRSVTEISTDGVHYLSLGCQSLVSDTLPWFNSFPRIRKGLPGPGSMEEHLVNTIVEDLEHHLSASLALRIFDIPTYNPTSDGVSFNTRIAILFSGGLDCSLIARLCHDVLPEDQSIDLLNIAFENPRTVRAAAAAAAMKKSSNTALTSPYESCPDRLTGRASYNELLEACPDRLWRFVAIDVPYQEMLSHRQTIIRLMQPHNTEMDLSIGMALYFASRGSGLAITSHNTEPETYTTPARVLLSGLGADELFGGYSRHAAAFSQGGWDALNDELELDFARIGSRNLGRDDRIMAHWAREVRYPYLDEDFVNFVLNLPAWHKVGFREDTKLTKHYQESPQGSVKQESDLDPAKLLLRRLMWRKGLRGAASEKKRAIQFGARTAKMEGGRTKGTDLLSMK